MDDSNLTPSMSDPSGRTPEFEALTPESIAGLRAHVRGDVIGRHDDRYDEARRVWNGMIDRRPVAIVRCRGAADVVEALRVAKNCGLPVSVRCGGHNVSGSALCERPFVGNALNQLAEIRP